MTNIENYVTNKLKDFHNPFYLCVSGNSMVPKINDGDRILVEPYMGKALRPGDIIVYRKFSDHLTVHRVTNIVRLSKSRFYCETKGDNNIEADSYKVFNSFNLGPVTTQVHYLKPILFDEYGSLKTHEIAELVQRRIQEKIDSILLPET